MGKKLPDSLEMHDRLVLNRKLLLVAHLAIGVPAAFLYMSRLDLSRFHYWGRSGTGASFIASPALIPYVVSAVRSWQLAPARRLNVWLFIGVLVAGAVLMAFFFIDAFGVDGTGPLIGAVVIQTAGYFWAAEHILEVD
jgi:hypothetical protein